MSQRLRGVEMINGFVTQHGKTHVFHLGGLDVSVTPTWNGRYEVTIATKTGDGIKKKRFHDVKVHEIDDPDPWHTAATRALDYFIGIDDDFG